jgi:hypothetical protein
MNTEQTALDKSKAKLEEISKSPKLKKELKKFFAEEKKKDSKKKKIQQKYFRRFDYHFKKPGRFEEIVTGLIKKHGDAYQMRCYKKGIHPYPNRELTHLFAYVLKKGIEPSRTLRKKISSRFTTDMAQFEGYIFEVISGQGVVGYLIYNKEGNVLLTGI